jgi:hypothetical protein
VEEARDADDPKAAMIALLLERQAEVGSSGVRTLNRLEPFRAARLGAKRTLR